MFIAWSSGTINSKSKTRLFSVRFRLGLLKFLVKVEGFIQDSATLCFNGKRSRYQKVNSVLQNASDLAYAHLQLKIFAGVKYVPRPLKGERIGKEGV
jgi:hypothetical protein